MSRLALKASELADACGVSPKTVRSWMKEGGLPYSRVGNLVLIEVERFRSWLRGREECHGDLEDRARDMVDRKIRSG